MKGLADAFPERMLLGLGMSHQNLVSGLRGHNTPTFVTPEHTAKARGILGDGPLLCPEQAVVPESDPATARAIGREYPSLYLGQPNYVNSVRELGFTEDDMADGGSDRFVDALVAWGDVDAILTRVRAHLDAGADHVAVQALPAHQRDVPEQQWRPRRPAPVAGLSRGPVHERAARWLV